MAEVRPTAGVAGPSREPREDLLREQYDAWRKGERVLVEAYRDRESLHEDGEAILDLICNEVFLREARQEALSLDEYLDRFPQLAAQLRQHFEVHRGLLDQTVPDSQPRKHSPNAALSTPGYELLGELGRGAMGVVYRARQANLGRLVALKMVNSGNLDSNAYQRFRAEAEAVASLDHPRIVPIYEVGEQGGQPFFTMKLLDGGSLDHQLSRFRNDPRAAVQILITVAQAVHHAHQRGILHRDLKPSNILFDADGQPYVADFGLAKRLEADRSMTQSTDLAGTPSYMAAEQASGRKGVVTIGTDVYGLGALLYALLTGRPPFRGETLLETLQQVKEAEPQPPSRSNPRVERDLDLICLKCLEKEPAKRYASAAALAEELQRHLGGEPLLYTRPVGRLERIRRWCRRKPLEAFLLGALLLAIIAGFVGVYWQKLQAERDRDKAILSEYQAAMSGAELLLEQGGDPADVQKILEGFRPEPGQTDLRDDRWHHLAWRCRLAIPQTLKHEPTAHCVAIAADGQRFATGGGDFTGGTIHVWDMATKQVLHTLRHPQDVMSLAFAGKSNILAAASYDRTVTLWDATSGAKLHTFEAKGVLVAFRLDGKRLAIADRDADGTVTVWDMEKKGRLHTFKHGRRVKALAYAPDGASIAVGDEDGHVAVWVMETGEQLNLARGKSLAHFGKVLSLVYAPDSRRLFSAGADGTAVEWMLVAMSEENVLSGHTRGVTAMAYLPKEAGYRLATASFDGTVILWPHKDRNAQTHNPPVHERNADKADEPSVVLDTDAAPIGQGSEAKAIVLNDRKDNFTSVVFSPDGMMLITTSLQGNIKLWDLRELDKAPAAR